MLSNPYRVFLHQVLEAFFQIKKKKNGLMSKERRLEIQVEKGGWTFLA